jgi:hypothetical protein
MAVAAFTGVAATAAGIAALATTVLATAEVAALLAAAAAAVVATFAAAFAAAVAAALEAAFAAAVAAALEAASAAALLAAFEAAVAAAFAAALEAAVVAAFAAAFEAAVAAAVAAAFAAASAAAFAAAADAAVLAVAVWATAPLDEPTAAIPTAVVTASITRRHDSCFIISRFIKHTPSIADIQYFCSLSLDDVWKLLAVWALVPAWRSRKFPPLRTNASRCSAAKVLRCDAAPLQTTQSISRKMHHSNALSSGFAALEQPALLPLAKRASASALR